MGSLQECYILDIYTKEHNDTTFFFFQAEAGIRDFHVTGVQTCALPISTRPATNTAMHTNVSATSQPGSPARGSSMSLSPAASAALSPSAPLADGSSGLRATATGSAIGRERSRVAIRIGAAAGSSRAAMCERCAIS